MTSQADLGEKLLLQLLVGVDAASQHEDQDHDRYGPTL